MSESAPFRIWAVDDKPSNLAMIAASLPPGAADWAELRSFLDVRAFLAEHERCCAEAPAALPDFILLDYFLGRMYGWQALDEIVAAYRRLRLAPAARPVIIGFSSWPQASDSLVRRGADFALRKIKGLPSSAALERNFCHRAALEQMRQTRRPFEP